MLELVGTLVVVVERIVVEDTVAVVGILAVEEHIEMVGIAHLGDIGIAVVEEGTVAEDILVVVLLAGNFVGNSLEVLMEGYCCYCCTSLICF